MNLRFIMNTFWNKTIEILVISCHNKPISQKYTSLWIKTVFNPFLERKDLRIESCVGNLFSWESWGHTAEMRSKILLFRFMNSPSHVKKRKKYFHWCHKDMQIMTHVTQCPKNQEIFCGSVWRRILVLLLGLPVSITQLWNLDYLDIKAGSNYMGLPATACS